MKVKINRASLRSFWYAKHIDKFFEAEISEQWPKRYELILPGETLKSFIRDEDAEIDIDT